MEKEIRAMIQEMIEKESRREFYNVLDWDNSHLRMYRNGFAKDAQDVLYEALIEDDSDEPDDTPHFLQTSKGLMMYWESEQKWEIVKKIKMSKAPFSGVWRPEIVLASGTSLIFEVFTKYSFEYQ